MANEESLTQVLQVFEERIFKGMENKLPVRVVSVSGDRKRVSVKPLISIVGENNQIISRGVIKGIPVFQHGAGGFLISFDINENDLGWIDTADRDISLFLQTYNESPPNTFRKHSFSDAQFIPDIMTDFTIDSEDSDSLVIQNREATVKISMNQNRINLRAPSISAVADSIDLEADQISMTADEINISAGDINIDGGVSISGNSCEIDSSVFMVNSSVASINGVTFTGGGDIVSDSGISLIDHIHAQGASTSASGSGPHTHAQQDTGPAKAIPPDEEAAK
ncbi:hypothetical protein VCHA30O60_50150 [Vibrio chagasii]|nr:hypothetical protein VCHA30O60_50150 [Vibrio chagasii]